MAGQVARPRGGVYEESAQVVGANNLRIEIHEVRIRGRGATLHSVAGMAGGAGARILNHVLVVVFEDGVG